MPPLEIHSKISVHLHVERSEGRAEKDAKSKEKKEVVLESHKIPK
jgi:hypothetical protein